MKKKVIKKSSTVSYPKWDKCTLQYIYSYAGERPVFRLEMETRSKKVQDAVKKCLDKFKNMVKE